MYGKPMVKKIGSRPSVPGRSILFIKLISLFMKFIHTNKTLSRQIKFMADMLDYYNWLNETFYDVTLKTSRQSVWDEIISKLRSEKKKVFVVELGVAYGYMTWWWFSKASDVILTWDGFDRFTGLPRKWRDLEQGTFSANGQSPSLVDERIKWHVGDVEETIRDFKFSDEGTESNIIKLIIFDLDIFEPSLIAWEHIKLSLKPGDIIYLDEAYDSDERKLIIEFIMKWGSFRFISSDWMCLALQLEAINNNN